MIRIDLSLSSSIQGLQDRAAASAAEWHRRLRARTPAFFGLRTRYLNRDSSPEEGTVEHQKDDVDESREIVAHPVVDASPSSVSHSFRTLMRHVQAGSPEAAAELLEAYGPHLTRVVRRHLDQRLRSKFDSADFVQSVWGAFFANVDRMEAFDQPDNLIAFLITLARNKVVDEFRRRLRTKKRDVRRESPLTYPNGDFKSFAGGSPTPSQVAMARERWDNLLAGLPGHHQRIVELRLAGATYQEIAQELDIDERTARRVIDRLMKERCPQ